MISIDTNHNMGEKCTESQMKQTEELHRLGWEAKTADGEDGLSREVAAAADFIEGSTQRSLYMSCKKKICTPCKFAGQCAKYTLFTKTQSSLIPLQY